LRINEAKRSVMLHSNTSLAMRLHSQGLLNVPEGNASLNCNLLEQITIYYPPLFFITINVV